MQHGSPKTGRRRRKSGDSTGSGHAGGTAPRPSSAKFDVDSLRDPSRGVRLHKAMADAGVGSRRACEQLIDQGSVSVNGVVVSFSPAWVDPTRDRVEVDGQFIGRAPPGRTYLMVNKPRGVISTNSDPQGRRRVIDLAPHGERLFCVGRLDAESTGLVLLTNDGELAQRLTHPRYGVQKTYEVAIKGSLSDEDLASLQRGMWLGDRDGGALKAAAAGVQVLQRDRQRTRLRIQLREGRNREIRRLVARLGHRVRRLKRIALGPLRLKGVPVGGWRALSRSEISALRWAATSSAAR